jgi:site-specific recombinase XerD
MTNLRRKMLEELQLRNYSPHTQRAYIRWVAEFAQHFKATPDQLSPDHIRAYQLFLVQRKKLAWSSSNQAVCALRFFYHDVLHRKWMIEHIPYPRHEQKLPVVLSPAAVVALFQTPPPETAHDPDDHLCGRAAGFRAHQLAGHGYRQSAPGNQGQSGQRPQKIAR